MFPINFVAPDYLYSLRFIVFFCFLFLWFSFFYILIVAKSIRKCFFVVLFPLFGFVCALSCGVFFYVRSVVPRSSFYPQFSACDLKEQLLHPLFYDPNGFLGLCGPFTYSIIACCVIVTFILFFLVMGDAMFDSFILFFFFFGFCLFSIYFFHEFFLYGIPDVFTIHKT
jgi:hypothetical protein